MTADKDIKVLFVSLIVTLKFTIYNSIYECEGIILAIYKRKATPKNMSCKLKVRVKGKGQYIFLLSQMIELMKL